MTYKILANQSINLLERDVNQFMQQGWEPIGGPFINPEHGAYDQFNQAMIRRTEVVPRVTPKPIGSSYDDLISKCPHGHLFGPAFDCPDCQSRQDSKTHNPKPSLWKLFCDGFRY